MDKLPKHIAFIMDGNGRWATKRALPRSAGHKYGVTALEKVVDACDKLGIEVVTFYAFSTENWARPQAEIDNIFKMLEKFAKKHKQTVIERNYCVRFIGDMSMLPEKTCKVVKEVIETSKNNKKLVINLAVNYGGRQEIVNAVNYVLSLGIKKVSLEELSDCMYTAGLPDPDIIVRSAGEKRLSNFLLWQCAYSELIFVDDYWPDFDENTINKILEEYSTRDRRYGKVKRLS